MMLQFHANGSKGVLNCLILMMVMDWNCRLVEPRRVLGQQRIQVYHRSGLPEIGTTLGLPIWRSTGSTANGNGNKGIKQHENEDKSDYYDDDVDDNLNDGGDDDDDDDDGEEEDYDENAPKIITNNNNKDPNLKEDKLLRLIALNAAYQKHAPISADAVDDPIANGRAVDHVDESRTFFKHKHSGGSGGGGDGGNGGNFYGGAPNFPPLFIVPVNLSNFNNNTVNTPTTTTTTVAPAGRITYIDNGFPQADFYRAPYMPTSFRRRAQNDNANAMLPYGLMTVWDGAQVLPVGTIHRTVGPDLHYLPLNLQRFGNNGGPSIGGGGGFGGGGGVGVGVNPLPTANNDNNNEDDDDFGDNGLTESDGRFNLFSSRWRTNPNPNRNVYENSNPFTAFANNFRRIQYL